MMWLLLPCAVAFRLVSLSVSGWSSLSSESEENTISWCLHRLIKHIHVIAYVSHISQQLFDKKIHNMSFQESKVITGILPIGGSSSSCVIILQL